jgi:hypothetical protein
MEKYDDFVRVKRIITSCVNYQQWRNAEKLEELFKIKHPKEPELHLELAYFSIAALYKIQDEQ